MRTSSLCPVMENGSIATRRKLLAWYRRNRRDLPWRRTTDPYPIWVSEIMLQQTRVAAALPYYERFLKRFPDVHTLARARIDSVLAHWSGLGYYRRARMLHAAAKVVSKNGFPKTAAGLRELPGIGAYTSNAIASISFGERVAVVDGNVERVLCRVHARADRRVAALAQDWMGRAHPGDFNQAVMELGALICTPQSPDCPRCPLKDACRGHAAPADYPRKKPRAKPVAEELAVAYVIDRGRVLLQRRDRAGVMQGLWELPPSRAQGAPLATVRHAIMDRRIVVKVYPGASRAGRFFTRTRAAGLPLTAAARKCLTQVGFLDDNPKL